MVAALASYLDARAQGGQWLLRIEDLDQARTQAGAARDILRTLEAFGFTWDAPVLYQSQRLDAYHAALMHLQADARVYPCACSRSEIASAANAQVSVDGGWRYPGTCRAGLGAGKAARAWRFCVPEQNLSFIDRIQGLVQQNLAEAVGDFVVWREGGQFTYQLAVVVDDAAQGVNAVVRGVDLLDSTPRQIALQQCLGLPTPSYAHVPVVVNARGEKLSKQTQAPAVDASGGSRTLAAAMRFLGHAVPPEIAAASTADFWHWAINAWTIAKLPAARAIFAGSLPE